MSFLRVYVHNLNNYGSNLYEIFWASLPHVGEFQARQILTMDFCHSKYLEQHEE